MREFTLCAFPWILDTASKSEILHVENQVMMQEERDKAMINSFVMAFQDPNQTDSMTLDLKVHRQNIVEETLNYLVKGSRSLKRELKVTFIGEPGQDEGGVRKEFFQLLVRDPMNPDYTMFKHYPDS